MSKEILGSPEFVSSSAIRQYCENARRLFHPLYHELHVSAEELEVALKYVKSADPKLGGLDSRLRAKLVSRQLKQAATAMEVASKSTVGTYMAFLKHYAPEVAQRRQKSRRTFDFDE
ncbi:plasmid transfer protein TraA [Saccharopolyspora sp. NPDC050642]|uniref:plasmid transfer protein TraA n=1 Tax=Saccharopolyspora sp. NPDC050642 TaxID=3157099 RepID=UPI0033DA5AEA